jgi:hypothetical protein
MKKLTRKEIKIKNILKNQNLSTGEKFQKLSEFKPNILRQLIKKAGGK